MINAVKLILIAVATVAAASGGAANAKTAARPIIATLKLPSPTVTTRPQIPKICLNTLDRGPGARKCG